MRRRIRLIPRNPAPPVMRTRCWSMPLLVLANGAHCSKAGSLPLRRRIHLSSRAYPREEFMSGNAEGGIIARHIREAHEGSRGEEQLADYAARLDIGECAMVLDAPGRPLRDSEVPEPEPGPEQVLLRVHACAVCRTDLHVVDGELPDPKLPLIPGHQIVGAVEGVGGRVERF